MQFIIFQASTSEIVSLPIYEAISFQTVLSGGRTNPWLVIVNENGREAPYVVKHFSQLQNDRSEAIVNEVIGNVLAREFDLPTPKPALIDIDSPSFIASIYDINAFATYEHSDSRINFGSEYIHPSYQFIKGSLTRNQAKRIVPIDSVFAYDNLIINRDRGQARTNLLMRDKQAYLIDHELAFHEIDHTTINNINNKIGFRGFEHHIFYDYLKHSNKKVKSSYFIEFEEYLRYLPVNNLDSFLQQLTHFGYVTNKHRDIMQYLQTVRNNSTNFVQLLHGLIT